MHLLVLSVYYEITQQQRSHGATAVPSLTTPRNIEGTLRNYSLGFLVR